MSKRKTTEEFIKEATEVHSDRYLYDKSLYKNAHAKLIITCPIHGDFEQAPHEHLKGQGCPRCKADKIGKLKSDNYYIFIEKANKVHGNKYLYDKAEYKGSRSPIYIGCEKHGYFLQKPNDHLNGCGCPKCKQSKLEREIEEFLTKNNIEFVYQKHFDWLGKQSLDFYLPGYNIAIECQGEQHFKPVGFGSKHKDENLIFGEIINRDVKKLELCNNNGINLLYYSDYPQEKFLDKKVYTNISDLLTVLGLVKV